MYVPSLSDGSVGIRPIRLRDSRALEKELLENRGWLRQWEATSPHAPAVFDTRASIRSLQAASRADPHASRDVFFLSLHYDDFHDSEIRGGLVCIDRRAGPPPAFGVALARTLTAHGWGRLETADGQAGLSADTLGVLNPAFNPVPQKALLEVATLSNLDDYLCATDPLWRAQVAEAVAQAISQVHAGR